MHTYFITFKYVTDGGEIGFASTDFYRSHPISGMEIIRDLEEQIRQDGDYVRVCITSFQRFEDPEKK